jgi:TPR repeat protein
MDGGYYPKESIDDTINIYKNKLDSISGLNEKLQRDVCKTLHRLYRKKCGRHSLWKRISVFVQLDMLKVNKLLGEDPEALYDLGWLNFGTIPLSMIKAAELGHHHAQYEAGQYYINNGITDTSQWMKRSAEQGNLCALYECARVCMIENDIKECEKYLIQCLETEITPDYAYDNIHKLAKKLLVELMCHPKYNRKSFVKNLTYFYRNSIGLFNILLHQKEYYNDMLHSVYYEYELNNVKQSDMLMYKYRYIKVIIEDNMINFDQKALRFYTYDYIQTHRAYIKKKIVEMKRVLVNNIGVKDLLNLIGVFL